MKKNLFNEEVVVSRLDEAGVDDGGSIGMGGQKIGFCRDGWPDEMGT